MALLPHDDPVLQRFRREIERAYAG